MTGLTSQMRASVGRACHAFCLRRGRSLRLLSGAFPAPLVTCVTGLGRQRAKLRFETGGRTGRTVFRGRG